MVLSAGLVMELKDSEKENLSLTKDREIGFSPSSLFCHTSLQDTWLWGAGEAFSRCQ